MGVGVLSLETVLLKCSHYLWRSSLCTLKSHMGFLTFTGNIENSIITTSFLG